VARWANTFADVDDLPAAPGAYVLMLELRRPVRLAIATLPATTLPPGRYAYAGSARGPGGIRARVRRHLRKDKKPHWHIDRLADLLRVPGASVPVPGFGSSDCRRCAAHLVALAGPDQNLDIRPGNGQGERTCRS
jgi:Uri superfamily endonuclease